MTLRWIASLVALFPAVALAAGQSTTPGRGAWSGVIVYNSCNADEAFNESPECFRAARGAKLSLYDDTNRVIYQLLPQEIASGHLGDGHCWRNTRRRHHPHPIPGADVRWPRSRPEGSLRFRSAISRAGYKP
jgi:hypothetical protein